MITRIPVATKLISTTIKTTITTPICNRSKSRAMQQHAKTVDLTTTPTQPSSPTVEHSHSHKTSRTTTTMHCWNISTLQVLLLVCLLPLLLPPATRRSYAAEALPITSKPIEGTAENLAWQAWLMLPPEQRQLEKSRKVTPKSIFSLPFRDCPPGHQLFQSRCIPTVNINQSDLLTQQVLGLFVGAEAAGGAGAGAAGGANAYEFDYGDEEYDLGLGEGEGESVMLFDVPQPFNSGGGGGGVVGTAAGSSNAQHTPVRDEPLKFNLFEQKFPTNDYEADLSSGSAMEGSGSARPFPELLAPTNGSEGERIDEAGNDNDAGATFFNSSLFLDAVQGFFQRHATAAGGDADNNATLAAIISTNNTNSTDHNNRIVNGNSTDRQVPSDDLHAAGSNVSAFSVDDIDAIILPAVSTGTTVKTISGGGEGEGSSADVDLEPQHISLFKDENSIKLLATVIAQQPANDNRIGGDSVAAGGDLIAASAQQQPHTVAQFLRADALLPLSSVAPYITTTTTTTSKTTVSTSEGRATPKRPTVSVAKDEHPRSVTQKSTAAAVAFSSSTDTDAQETSFITTTEPEGTTSFQIDETTVVETSAGDADAVLPTSRDTLLEAILKQQQLEGQKSKVEKLKDVPTADALGSVVNEETTTTKSTTIETKPTTNEISETATPTPTETAAETVKPINELNETTTTTPQPLPTSAATAPSLIIATTTATTTTTAKAILANNTPNTYRFRSTPTVASAAVTAIHTVASKQVPAVVATSVPQQSASTQQAGAEITTIKTSLNDDAVGSGEAVSDVPRSGNNDDLVNVVAASRNSINSNTNNDLNNKRNENNKNSQIRREPAAAEVNIEQELRMINELVKGNRQLAATKMAAIKTTETETESATTATTTTAPPSPLDSSTQLTTASETNSALEVQQKSTDTTAAAGELSVVSASGVVAVKVRQGIVGEKTTTMDNTQTVEDTTSLVPTPASASSDIFTTTTTTTTQTTTTTSAKMESVNQSSEATITTVENSKFAAAKTSSTRKELLTKTNAEPDYETETVEGTVADVEGTGATTLWSRIMPIFGFGGEAAAAATATQEIAESVTVSSSISSSSSRSSISDSSINFSENTNIDEHNNKHNNNNNNKFEMPSRRNSKIIRIDHLDDNNVVNPSVATAVGATTTNTLEETAATAITTTTTADENLKTIDDLAITPEQDPTEVSTFWWLPANWRLNRETSNEEQQPLLFRLWSAFPESQMKAKART